MECPSQKTCHQTKQQAMRQIRSSEKRGAPRLRVYKCPDCGWFHVTSQLLNKKALIK
jgi:hypothetical protein